MTETQAAGLNDIVLIWTMLNMLITCANVVDPIWYAAAQMPNLPGIFLNECVCFIHHLNTSQYAIYTPLPLEPLYKIKSWSYKSWSYHVIPGYPIKNRCCQKSDQSKVVERRHCQEERRRPTRVKLRFWNSKRSSPVCGFQMQIVALRCILSCQT